MQKNNWIWITAGLICILIMASYSTAFFYLEYSKYEKLYHDALNELRIYEPYIFVNILIDYGNETREWHNNTLVGRGADILNATVTVSHVQYSTGQWGSWVSTINEVGGDPNTYWIYNIWNSTNQSWDMGLVASDSYILAEGETFAWVYQEF